MSNGLSMEQVEKVTFLIYRLDVVCFLGLVPQL